MNRRLSALLVRLVREDIPVHYDDIQDALIVLDQFAVHDDEVDQEYYVLFKSRAMQTEIPMLHFSYVAQLFGILAEENEA